VRDAIISAAQAVLTDVSGVELSAEAVERHGEKVTEAQVPFHEAVHTSCVDGSSHSFASTFSAGFALKNALKAKSTKTLKANKFAFIAFVHGKGDKDTSGPNAVKISPEQAARLMPLVGTQDGEFKYPNDPFMKASSTGQRLFQRLELLHPCQISSTWAKLTSSWKSCEENGTQLNGRNCQRQP
jgi:hypothetical protein